MDGSRGGGAPVNQRARIPVRWGGYHRPVCVETVVGPLHHFKVEGWGRQLQQMCQTMGRIGVVTRQEEDLRIHLAKIFCSNLLYWCDSDHIFVI